MPILPIGIVLALLALDVRAAELPPCPALGAEASRPPTRGAPSLPSIPVLRDERGQAYAPSRLAGRPLILNFWAEWCAPCREEIPSLIRYARARGARLLAVHVGGRGSLDPLLRRWGWQGLETARIDLKDARGAFALGAIPLTLIYDSSGTLRGRQDTPCLWPGE